MQTDEGNGADEDVEPEGTEGAVGVKRPNDPVAVGIKEVDVSFEDSLAGVRCCPCRRPPGGLKGWREIRTSGAWRSALGESSGEAMYGADAKVTQNVPGFGRRAFLSGVGSYTGRSTVRGASSIPV